MKCIKKTVRHYWKYTDKADIDLSDSNNTSYVSDKKFYANQATSWSTTQTYTLNSTKYAKRIYINSTGWVQQNAGWKIIISVVFSSGVTTSILTKDFGYGTAPSLQQTIDLGSNETVKSITVYASCYRSSSQYCYGGITIGFSYDNVIQGTSSDYDYYTDDVVMSMPDKFTRHYYKYDYKTWTQPTLSSNGTIGGTSFAMSQSSTYSSYYAYRALYGSGSLWHSGQSIPAWCEWYNPYPLKIDKLSFGVGNGTANPDMPKVYKIQACDDGTNWIDLYTGTNSSTSPIPLPITVDLTGVKNREYKYWRYYVASVLGRNFGNLRNLQITATYKAAIVESTSSDYDFYEDRTDYYRIGQ